MADIVNLSERAAKSITHAERAAILKAAEEIPFWWIEFDTSDDGRESVLLYRRGEDVDPPDFTLIKSGHRRWEAIDDRGGDAPGLRPMAEPAALLGALAAAVCGWQAPTQPA